MSFHVETLPNGLTILAEIAPAAVSSALGFFVRCGARDEEPGVAGVSHFLEHMAFKGDGRRSAEELNRAFDDLGASFNAYTAEEHTVYHASALPEFVEPLAELLASLLRPALRTADFETEKLVILEEIGMYADSPAWSCYEQAMARHFGSHPVGQSVLGTKETIAALTADAMRGYHETHYGAEQVIVAAAGQIDWPRFRDRIAELCGDWRRCGNVRNVPRGHGAGRGVLVHEPKFQQQSAMLLAPAPPADHPLRLAAEALTIILADDTGSRFHWELVEPGHVDALEFGYHEYEGTGAFMLSTTASAERTPANLKTALEVFRAVARDGVTDAELTAAKTKMATRVALAVERPRNRLGPIAYEWSYRRGYCSVDGDLAALAAITPRHLAATLDEYPLLPATLALLGPLPTAPDLGQEALI